MNIDLRLKGITSLMLYLGIILMIFTDFDLIILPVVIIIVIVLSYYRFHKKEATMDKFKDLKDEILRIKERIRAKGNNQEVLEYFNITEKKIDLMIKEVDEDYVFQKLKVDSAVLTQTDILKKKKVTLREKLEETIGILSDLMNYEEIKLIQFLNTKHKISYTKFMVFEVFILIITIVLAFTTFIFNQSIFYLCFFLFFLLFGDIKYLIELIFRKGYLRYKIVRKKFDHYQIQLKLLLNNSLNRQNIEEYEEFYNDYSMLNKKICDYQNAIPSYYSYTKKIELIGIIGITLSLLFFLVQGYIYTIPDFIKFDIVELLFSFIFVYVVMISPSSKKRREYKEEQMFKAIYERIDKNFKIIQDVQFFLIIHHTKLI